MNIIRAIKKNKVWSLLCLASLILSIVFLKGYFAGPQIDYLNDLTEVSGILDNLEDDEFNEQYNFKLQGDSNREYHIKKLIDVDPHKMLELKKGQHMTFKAIVLEGYYNCEVYQLTVDGEELISLEDAKAGERKDLQYSLLLGIVFLVCFVIAAWFLPRVEWK